MKNWRTKRCAPSPKRRLKVSPTGKQNSFASRALCVLGAGGKKVPIKPRSLAAAFYQPINGGDQLDVAVQRITALRENMNTVYGQADGISAL